MRELANEHKIFEFFKSLGRTVRKEARVYLTGGSTAVLTGWRDTTVDIDIKFEPEIDEIFRALPELKEKLGINIELASPSDFIPPVPGWQERSQFITREGKVSFFHYDPYSQALSKIERGHEKDLLDVQAMLDRGMIDPARLYEYFKAIEPHLYRYPAIDPPSFSKAVNVVTNTDEK